MSVTEKALKADLTTVSEFSLASRMKYGADSSNLLEADKNYTDEIFRSFKASGCEVLSLDVFDTILLRNGKSELRRFFEIAEKAVTVLEEAGASEGALTAADALVLRNFATIASYRASPVVEGCREGCLEDICATISKFVFGDARATDRLVQAELEYEATQLMVSSAIRSLVLSHHADGGKVICISDMYMKSKRIESLISALDPALFEAIDCVFSSSDLTVSKSSGRIFDKVSSDLGMSPGDFFHVGDALLGDYQRPRQYGWNALYLPVPRKLQEERREDHRRCAKELLTKYGVKLVIAEPQVH